MFCQRRPPGTVGTKEKMLTAYLQSRKALKEMLKLSLEWWAGEGIPARGDMMQKQRCVEQPGALEPFWEKGHSMLPSIGFPQVFTVLPWYSIKNTHSHTCTYTQALDGTDLAYTLCLSCGPCSLYPKAKAHMQVCTHTSLTCAPSA